MPVFASRSLLSFCFAAALVGAAHADPAPITYAGQGQTAAPAMTTASLGDGLAGGDDNSYGYGRSNTARTGAVIDLRRPSAPSSAAPQQYQPQRQPQPAATPARDDQGGEGRPAWLEQERVGPPYEAGGRWYVPTPEPGYAETGIASWYGPQFHGRQTASGETFDQEALTAAHPTLPIPSLVQVTNLENGREVIVRVNDRGPFVGERLIDLSRRSAEVLGFEGQGHARVHVRYLGPAPRRVNADGSMAPVPANPPPAPVNAVAQHDGPMPLTVQHSQPSVEQARLGAPMMAPQPAPAAYAPPALAAAVGDYFVQVGAFSDLANAQRVQAAVSEAGPALVDVRETARGELFRVRIGPWVSREQAEAARQTLASLGYYDSIVAGR